MKRRNLLKSLLSAISLNAIPVAKVQAATTWSYQGEIGTDFWGELDPEYRACNLGEAQSPIDLKPSVTDNNLGSLELDYRDTPLSVVNNGHTIRVDYQPGSKLILNGRIYELLQFHFHQPSEHLVLGKASEMEAHFVHKNQNTGDLVVLAVLMKRGKANLSIDNIWQKIFAGDRQESQVSDLVVNALRLLPENINRYYCYQGSLTTPPCTETVTWLVLKQPIEVSKVQIARFLEVVGTNARPVQALNHRSVLEHN